MFKRPETHSPQLMIGFILFSIDSNNLVYTLLELLSLLDVTNLISPQIWSFSESLGKDSTFPSVKAEVCHFSLSRPFLRIWFTQIVWYPRLLMKMDGHYSSSQRSHTSALIPQTIYVDVRLLNALNFMLVFPFGASTVWKWSESYCIRPNWNPVVTRLLMERLTWYSCLCAFASILAPR